MASNKRIFVVIPAYQAADTIGDVLARVPRQTRDQIVKFLVVNDGSTDDTERVVKALAARDCKIELINHPQNRGYAAAQKTGLRAALNQGADIAVLLHSDGQYAPEMMPTLLEPLLRDEADVVQGSRMLGGALKGGMPLYKYIANKTLTFVENLAYGLHMAEYHSGYMLYNRKTLESIPFERLSNTYHFDGEMILMASKRKLRIREIPIPTHYGREKSYLNPIKYGFDVLGIILKNALGQYDF